MEIYWRLQLLQILNPAAGIEVIGASNGKNSSSFQTIVAYIGQTVSHPQRRVEPGSAQVFVHA